MVCLLHYPLFCRLCSLDKHWAEQIWYIDRFPIAFQCDRFHSKVTVLPFRNTISIFNPFINGKRFHVHREKWITWRQAGQKIERRSIKSAIDSRGTSYNRAIEPPSPSSYYHCVFLSVNVSCNLIFCVK